MERITKTRDLMALCRSLETEGEEQDIDSLIESLARIAYGKKQRYALAEQHKTDCEIGARTTTAEHVADVDNETNSQLSEGSKKKSKGIENLEPERVDTSGNWVKRGAEYERMGKAVVAPEIIRGPLPIGAGGQETCSQGWSFMGDDFHDEKRRADQKGQGRKARQKPPIILRGSKSVFDPNDPIDKKIAGGSFQRVNALKDGYIYVIGFNIMDGCLYHKFISAQYH